MEMIHPGDKIVIGNGTGSADRTSGPSTSTAGNLYVVKPGDTAFNIAILHGMTLDQLQQLNPNKKNLALIQPGNQIVVKGRNEIAGSEGFTNLFSKPIFLRSIFSLFIFSPFSFCFLDLFDHFFDFFDFGFFFDFDFLIFDF